MTPILVGNVEVVAAVVVAVAAAADAASITTDAIFGCEFELPLTPAAVSLEFTRSPLRWGPDLEAGWPEGVRADEEYGGMSHSCCLSEYGSSNFKGLSKYLRATWDLKAYILKTNN